MRAWHGQTFMPPGDALLPSGKPFGPVTPSIFRTWLEEEHSTLQMPGSQKETRRAKEVEEAKSVEQAKSVEAPGQAKNHSAKDGANRPFRRSQRHAKTAKKRVAKVP